MGKGDKQRQGNSEKLISNWDRIFGANKAEGNNTSNIEPFHISNARSLKMKDIKYKEKIAKKKLKKQKELFDRLDKEVEEEDRKGK
jgi:hypothetical protein|tara:strand:+ start:437 stop:694 length:258 start_codon:yes stop_codon:yes gene_type:complete